MKFENDSFKLEANKGMMLRAHLLYS